MIYKKSTQPRKEIELNQKSEFWGIKNQMQSIIWNSTQNKFFLKYMFDKNSLRVLDPESGEISTPITRDSPLHDFKITKPGDRLIILSDFILVFQLKDFSIEKQILIPQNVDFFTFTFADKSCQNIYLNSETEGLYKMNLNSGQLVKLNFIGLNESDNKNFIISSNYKILYGNFFIMIPQNFPASYNVERGFKHRFYPQKFSEFYKDSNALSRNDSVLFLGDQFGRLSVTDLRSYKTLLQVRIKSKNWIYCLQSRENFIFGGTECGELFIMEDFHPFSILYYKKMNNKIYNITFKEKNLVVGGRSDDPLKIFEILDIQSSVANDFCELKETQDRK